VGGCKTLAGVVGLMVLAHASGAAAASDIERGQYVLNAGGCITCHTDKVTLKAKGPVLGGGREIKTPFGVFYSPNITPDRDHGIGRWSEADFVRAMREGRSPEGRHYYPAFPYTSFTRISDRDLKALWAYLRTVPPVARANKPHKLRFPFSQRFGLGFWKWLYFRPGPYRPDSAKSAEWNRGAYLVTALGHCGECHTPRTALGGLEHDRWLAGSAGGPVGKAPNITPDKPTGIGDWSAADIVSALKIGMLPDGDFVGAEMADVVEYDTSRLTGADLKAIAAYLKSLPAVHNDVSKKK
jgi:mono/diheme cytochrome c family protein